MPPEATGPAVSVDAARERRVGGRRHSDLVATTLLCALPHELRRSLAVISLLADALGGDGDAGEQISLAVRRIDRLMGTLSQVARAIARAEAVVTEPLVVSRVIGGTMSAFALDPDRCEVHVEREAALPPVRGNAVLAEMILLNLLSNASRYGRAPVALEVRRSGTTVAFAVRAAGPGRARDALVGMAERTAAVPRAMGMGLAISQLFATRMGGWLDLEPEPGVSSVSLCLPVAARP